MMYTRLEHIQRRHTASPKQFSMLAIALCCAVATVIALVSVATPARAEESTKGTLTLELAHTAQGQTTYFSGVTATAYQVASVDEESNRYVLTTPFAKLDGDFNQPMNASEAEQLAKDAKRLVSDGAQGVTSTTSGDDGALSFAALDDGVYLITMEHPAADGEVWYAFDPFLVYVPMPGDGGTSYTVTCLPKMMTTEGDESNDDSGAGQDPSDDDNPENPDDSDNPSDDEGDGDDETPDDEGDSDNPDDDGDSDEPDSDEPDSDEPDEEDDGDENGSSRRTSSTTTNSPSNSTTSRGTTGTSTQGSTTSGSGGSRSPLSKTSDATDGRLALVALALGGAAALLGVSIRRRISHG